MSLEQDKRLIIWISALGDVHGGVKDAAWVYYISEGDHGLCDSLAKKRALSDHVQKNIFVVLPGQWAKLSTVELPKMRPQEIASAAGFAIEDQLGTGLSQQHIAFASRKSGDMQTVRVGAISSQKMNAVLRALAEAGLKADGFYIDHDVLPVDGAAYVLTDRIIKAGPDGFTIDPDMQGLLEGLENGLSQAELNYTDIAQLSHVLNFDAGVNFLQGRYVAKRFELGQVKGFARVGALAAGLAISGLIWTGLNARALKSQAADMNMQMRSVYQLATGQNAPSNPALAVSRAMRSGGDIEADFLSLSALLFTAMTGVPNVSLDSLQFDDSNHRLSIRLIYPSFDSASDMEEAVSRLGGRFQTGGVREQGERLIGDAILSLEPRS